MTVSLTATSKIPLAAALIFATAIAVVNGFGRFAYALLLPVMRDDLAWDYALSGWLNTANSLGYGVGALAGLFLLSRFRPATLFVAGLAITVVTLLLCGITRDLWLMMFWRFACGIGSAWVFACGGALVAAHYGNDPAQSAAAIAIYYAGGGLGIALSGVLLYPVLGTVGGQHWSWAAGWVVLGVAAFVLSIAPSRLALRIGGQTSAVASDRLPWRDYSPIMLAYFLFGVGYIVYVTFVIAWLRDMRLGFDTAVVVWLVLGVAVMASGFVWRRAMARWWPIKTFAAATLCTAAGTALPLLSNHIAILLLSAVLVGGSFFMAPGAMLALARNTLPPHLWAKAMNLFTFVFAIGQGVGPVAAGWIADHHGLNWAMGAGAITLLLCAGVALLQPRRSELTSRLRSRARFHLFFGLLFAGAVVAALIFIVGKLDA